MHSSKNTDQELKRKAEGQPNNDHNRKRRKAGRHKHLALKQLRIPSVVDEGLSTGPQEGGSKEPKDPQPASLRDPAKITPSRDDSLPSPPSTPSDTTGQTSPPSDRPATPDVNTPTPSATREPDPPSPPAAENPDPEQQNNTPNLDPTPLTPPPSPASENPDDPINPDGDKGPDTNLPTPPPSLDPRPPPSPAPASLGDDFQDPEPHREFPACPEPPRKPVRRTVHQRTHGGKYKSAPRAEPGPDRPPPMQPENVPRIRTEASDGSVNYHKPFQSLDSDTREERLSYLKTIADKMGEPVTATRQIIPPANQPDGMPEHAADLSTRYLQEAAELFDLVDGDQNHAFYFYRRASRYHYGGDPLAALSASNTREAYVQARIAAEREADEVARRRARNPGINPRNGRAKEKMY